MEKSRLPPELQSMVDQFTRFRNEYLALKTNYTAQEELIKLQKLELQKMNSHVENLASTLIDYQKRFNSTLQHMESENQRLQKIIDNTRREYEDSRDNDTECAREIQRNNDDYIHKLEVDVEALRAEVLSQEEKHQEQIKSIEERHRNEISAYDEKIERINLLEKRYKDEIDAYKKKLQDVDSMERRFRATISKNIENSADSMVPELNAKNNYPECSHPALDNANTQNTANKRKKNAAASHRWPQLDISVKKEKETAQKSVQKKKKKLYAAADDDVVVDLAP